MRSIAHTMAKTQSTWRLYAWLTNRYGRNTVWTRSRIQKWTIVILTFTLLFGAGFLFAHKANASSYIKVEVFWAGTDCIEVRHATGRLETACGGYGWWYATVYDGEDTGLDPIMGNADAITCKFWMNGYLEYIDFATRGDGTDVNCIRNYYEGPQHGLFT